MFFLSICIFISFLFFLFIVLSHVIQSGPKNVYTLAAVRRLRQCLDADGGHFEHLHWIKNSRTSLISILLLYKYSSYDYRVIFFMSKCVYIFWGHSVVYVLISLYTLRPRMPHAPLQYSFFIQWSEYCSMRTERQGLITHLALFGFKMWHPHYIYKIY